MKVRRCKVQILSGVLQSAKIDSSNIVLGISKRDEEGVM